MKMIVFLLYSSLTFAGDGFKEFFQFLMSPDGNLQTLDCPDSNGAAHCADLAAEVCKRSRGTSRIQINNSLKTKLGDRSYNARREVIRSAQEEALNRIPLSWDEVSSHYVSIRANLMKMVSDQPGIPQDVKVRMTQRMSAFRLIDSETFFQEQIAKALEKKSNSNISSVQNEIMTIYSSRCGETGMNESSFMMDDSIVLCPGALIQGIDNGALDSEEYLNSLTFLLAHEASHPISSEHFPQVYQEMASCYTSVSAGPSYWNQKGDEISSDYWASRLLAQRFATTGTTNNLALVGLFHNFGARCSSEASESVPSTDDRLNLILGRNPVMREVLGCLPPTAENPVCGLLGKQP